ncbi:MAG: glutaminyl-peptide cyclotransferase [Pirellulaceae bacterium]|nr:glutaminyl-peptide cyclotransferase [Pirellulaceae bacterium]
MANRRGRRALPDAKEAPVYVPPPNHSSIFQLSYRNYLRLIFVLIVLGGSYLVLYFRNMASNVPRYSVELIEKYPKDPLSFTQGLVFDASGEFLYESTGLLGQSSFRKIDWKTGEVLVKKPLDNDLFGEGLTFLKGKFYQLTWKNDLILVYDQDMNLLETRDFNREMWGLTTDGTHLIISNGTSQLMYVDPQTLQIIKRVAVRRANPTWELNDLEFNNGRIYANLFRTDLICEIDNANGEVIGIIDLDGLWPMKERPADGLMNGIAVNRKLQKMFVTGKLCPYLYQIEIVPQKK